MTTKIIHKNKHGRAEEFTNAVGQRQLRIVANNGKKLVVSEPYASGKAGVTRCYYKLMFFFNTAAKAK